MKNLVLGRLWTGKPDAVALCTIALLFALNVYRAWTQSITADEALSYNSFIARPISHVFVDYQAGNHVLQFFLSKISILLFGHCGWKIAAASSTKRNMSCARSILESMRIQKLKRQNADCLAAISVTQLYDVYTRPGTYQWLRELTPVAKVGYSIYVYDLRKRRIP